MSPNLMLLVKNACNPCNIFYQEVSKSNNNGLYYSAMPVPGIYSENSRGARYLIALKPNGKKEVESIFRHNPKEDSTVHLANSKANSIENVLAQVTDKDTTMTISKSADMTSDTDLDIDTENNPDGPCAAPYTNYRWSSSVSSLASSASYYSCGETPRPPPNSIATTGTATPISKNGSTITLSEPMKFPHLPSHQDRNSQAPANKSKLKFWKSNNDTRNHLSLLQIDLAGYKFLDNPVKIEYNNILSSWRFSDEISARKMTITGCKEYDCQEEKGNCKKAVQQEWMALDDAQSWVLVNEIVTRKALKTPTNSKEKIVNEITSNQQTSILKGKKRGSKHGFENEVLFRTEFINNDDKLLVMKAFSENDGVCQRMVLDVRKGRFVCPFDGEEELKNWMKVVRYIEDA
jgi:hypothetical protein